jgi:hypothetical protein
MCLLELRNIWIGYVPALPTPLLSHVTETERALPVVRGDWFRHEDADNGRPPFEPGYGGVLPAAPGGVPTAGSGRLLIAALCQLPRRPNEREGTAGCARLVSQTEFLAQSR